MPCACGGTRKTLATTSVQVAEREQKEREAANAADERALSAAIANAGGQSR